MTSQQFTATVAAATLGRVLIPVPFTPDTVWGTKPRHHIAGTVNHMRVRGVLEPAGDGFGFTLGPAWLRGCGVTVGDTVAVDIEPEGPQRDDLAEDIAVALAAHPQAAASSTPWPSSTDAPSLDRRYETTPRQTRPAHRRNDPTARSWAQATPPAVGRRRQSARPA